MHLISLERARLGEEPVSDSSDSSMPRKRARRESAPAPELPFSPDLIREPVKPQGDSLLTYHYNYAVDRAGLDVGIEPAIKDEVSLAILDILVTDLFGPAERLAERLVPSVPVHVINSVRRALLDQTVQPTWFHQAVIEFEGYLSPDELLAHIQQRIPDSAEDKYRNPDYLHTALSVWIDWCIKPLFAFREPSRDDVEPPCQELMPGIYGLSTEMKLAHLQRLRTGLIMCSRVDERGSAARAVATRAIMKHMSRGLGTAPEEAAHSVLFETGLTIPVKEAHELLRLFRRFFMQPGWLHNLILESSDSVKLIGRINELSLGRYSEDHLRVRVALWEKFCIHPLRAGDAQKCSVQTVTSSGQSSQVAVLEEQTVRSALEWLGGLSWIPLE